MFPYSEENAFHNFRAAQTRDDLESNRFNQSNVLARPMLSAFVPNA
jgi:hypothetical protein